MSGETEHDYGVIPDRLSWEMPLDKVATSELGPFQVFSADIPVPDADGNPYRVRSLARVPSLGVYVRNFADGGGENGLHGHDDDAIWFVLSGRATFHGPDGLELGDLAAHQGVLVRRGARYRFVCSGPTVIARFAASST